MVNLSQVENIKTFLKEASTKYKDGNREEFYTQMLLGKLSEILEYIEEICRAGAEWYIKSEGVPTKYFKYEDCIFELKIKNHLFYLKATDKIDEKSYFFKM